MKTNQIKLSSIIDPIKGKVPAQLDYTGNDALPYLSPDYLRRSAKPVFCKPSKNSVIVENGEVILLWDGSNAGEFFKGKSGVLASTMSALKINDEYNSDYIYYSLELLEYYLKAQTSGSGIPHVDKEVLGNLSISSFEFPVQSKIAEILSTVDKAIEQTEAIIAKQQRIKTGLMQDLLTKGIDEHGNIRSGETHEFKDSPLGRIPVEWKWDYLGSALKKGNGLIQTGPFGSQLHASDYVDEGIPIITVEHLGDNEIYHTNLPLVGKDDYKRLKKYTLLKGDLVFSRVGAIDRCSYVSSEENGWLFSGRCLRVRCCTTINSIFLSHQLNGNSARNWILNNAVGSTMPCLNTSILSNLPIILPKIEEQKDIVQVLESVLNSIQKEFVKLNKLSRLKNALVQDLLTGKVRLPAEMLGKE